MRRGRKTKGLGGGSLVTEEELFHLLGKAIMYVLMMTAVIMILASPAMALEVGIGEPFAWGGDDQWNTKKAIARTGLDRMQELGVQWHRDWISWKDWQPEKPVDGRSNIRESSIGMLDSVVNMSQARGIKVYALITNAPLWANGRSEGTYIPGDGDPGNPEFQKFVEDYGNFVFEVVSMYKGRIDYWEIWPEPDLAPNWRIDNPPLDFNERVRKQARGYSYLLKTAYVRAKEANPNAVIISGGVTSFTSDWFMPALYEYGAGPYFDKMGIHPYTLNQKPSESRLFSRIGNIRRTMNNNGDVGKAIWITETGWTTAGSSPTHTVTEAQKKEYLTNALQTVLTDYPSIEVLTFFRLMDQRWYDYTDTEAGYGLLHTDYFKDGVTTGQTRYQPKDVYYELKSYIESQNSYIPFNLQMNQRYWSNFSDYLSGNLAVSWTIRNMSSDNYRDVSIKGIRTSDGIKNRQSLPLIIGDVDPGASSQFTTRFHVPKGVEKFLVSLEGEARDRAGNLIKFPHHSTQFGS